MSYTQADALKDCSHRKKGVAAAVAAIKQQPNANVFLPQKVSKVKDLDLPLYEELWQSLLKWIVTDFDRGRGINIPFLMRVTWRSEIDVDENCRVLRPVFIPADGFLRSHNLLLKHRLKPEELNGAVLGKCEEINFAKIAIRYSQQLTKDQVFTGTRKVFFRLGQVMSEGKRVRVDFGIGELQCNERKLEFVFNPEFLRRTLVEDENGSTQALESLSNSYFPQRSHSVMEGSRAPSRGGASVACSTTELAFNPHTHLSSKRSELAIEQAYQRFAQTIDQRERDERRVEMQHLSILQRQEIEERMKEEERKRVLAEQAAYIRHEIARKEDERKRSKIDERSEVGIVLEASRPGKVMAFPVEPDPIPLQAVRRKEQSALRNYLLEQVESKKRERKEQRMRDALETKNRLTQIEQGLASEMMEKELHNRTTLLDLQKHRERQRYLKHMADAKGSPSPTKGMMGGNGSSVGGGVTSRPASVGMRTFEIMTPAQMRGGVGATPLFTR